MVLYGLCEGLLQQGKSYKKVEILQEYGIVVQGGLTPWTKSRNSCRSKGPKI